MRSMWGGVVVAHVGEVVEMKSEWSGVAAFALIVAWICWVLWFLMTHYLRVCTLGA